MPISFSPASKTMKFRVTHLLRTESIKTNKSGCVDKVINLETKVDGFDDERNATRRFDELRLTWDNPRPVNEGTILDIHLEELVETLCGPRWKLLRSASFNEHVLVCQKTSEPR